jgi:Flp pilus assembly protein TadG
MSNPRLISPSHRREQGQTIVLVALALVTLLAMAALAIDVVTLYVARSEMQRAADAAALAGAKALVDSGVTTDPTNLARQTLATNMATAGINAILQQNKIAGVAPLLVGTPAPSWGTLPPGGNPQITVTLQRTDLPTFFARIWGSRLATVTASATAEAYNPSNWQTSTGISVAAKCVKPLLIPNQDPGSGSNFVDPNTGVATTGILGEKITLSDACPNGSATCGPPVVLPSPLVLPSPPTGYYLPAAVTANAANLCPSCQGSSAFEQSIECCDFNVYSCGGTPATPNATIDTSLSGNNSRQDTHQGVQCLIHKPGEDTLDPASVANFIAGTGPMEITAGSGPLSGQLVTTSSSIATLPIFDTASLNAVTGQVTVVGFLQVFIGDVIGNGDITVTVLNVAGCGNTAGTTVISGGGVSPVPVRLIHQ